MSKTLTFAPRRTERVTYIDYKEVTAMLAEFFERDPEYYTLVTEMSNNGENPGWTNDSIVGLSIDPKNPKEKGLRPKHLKEAKAKNKVEWPWEFDAVMNEIARTTDKLPTGEYIIEICW